MYISEKCHPSLGTYVSLVSLIMSKIQMLRLNVHEYNKE